MSDTARQRIEFLRREIDRHDRLYYVEAKPVIGDRDYDLLYGELLELESRYPEFADPSSPTQRVSGEPISIAIFKFVPTGEVLPAERCRVLPTRTGWWCWVPMFRFPIWKPPDG